MGHVRQGVLQQRCLTLYQIWQHRLSGATAGGATIQTHLPLQQLQLLTVIEAEAQGSIGEHSNQAGCHTLHTRGADTSEQLTDKVSPAQEAVLHSGFLG